MRIQRRARFVIDTNQVDAVRVATNLSAQQKRHVVLVLPPSIWAEIARSGYGQSRQRALLAYDLRFGMDYDDILSDLADLHENDIPGYDPLVPCPSESHDMLRLRMRQSEKRRAECYIGAQKRIVENLSRKLTEARKDTRDAMSRGEEPQLAKNIQSIDEAMQYFAADVNSRLGSGLIREIRGHGNGRFVAKSCEGLYQAIMRNYQLRRYHQAMVAMHVAYAHGWGDENLNIDVSANRNDLADISLTLYARDGDVVVTNDRYFRRLMRCIDPEGAVQLLTWDECLGRVESHALA